MSNALVRPLALVQKLTHSLTVINLGRLLCHHYRLLSCPDCGYVHLVCDCSVPTYWWQGETD